MEKYDIGNRIYELRKEKGISQKELGEMLGVSNKSVSKWETGAALPKTETLVRLAEFFDISSEELLQGTTKDKVTLSTLSAEANRYFLQEELNKRDEIEKSKEAKSRKQYLAISVTLFITIFVLSAVLNISGLVNIEDASPVAYITESLITSYFFCGLFTGVVLLIKTVKKFDIGITIIACIFFPLTFAISFVIGITMVIPEIIKSIKIIKEDNNGQKQS